MPVPVDAVTVRVVPLPVTDVTAGVPDRPAAASEKFAAATPATASPNVTVHETAAAFVGDEPTAAIDTPAVVGAVVSKVYACPATGTEPPSALPATSWIVPLLVRLS